MLRDRESLLLDLCQRGFAAAEWHSLAARLTAAEVAVVARYLADTGWYGHTAELAAVAECLAPGTDYPTLARKTNFSPSRFRGMLQHRLAHACHP